MIVLKVIGIIVAVIALLAALLLLLPLDILLQADNQNGFSFHVRFLGIRFGGENESKQQPPKGENPLVKAVKKSLGISHLESAKALRSTVEQHGTAVTVKETVELIILFVDRLVWVVKRCRVPKCRILSVSGGENAAIEYGIACATVYPLVTHLQNNTYLRQRGLRVEVRCDYQQPQSHHGLELVVRLKTVHLLRVFLHIVKKNVDKELRQGNAEKEN